MKNDLLQSFIQRLEPARCGQSIWADDYLFTITKRATMKIWLRSLLLAGLAAVVTLATSVIGTTIIATYPDIMGCESACLVAAGGWPVPYLVDYPGISPVGSVSLTDAVLGIDKIWPAELATTFLFWLAISALAVWTLVRKGPDGTSLPVH